MRVHQFAPSVTFGDAISNQVQSLWRLLRNLRSGGDIWVEQIPDHYPGRVRLFSRYARRASSDDLLLVHSSSVYSGTAMDWLARAPGRKVFVYHNITPHEYFEGVSRLWYERARMGREQLSDFRSLTVAGWGDSAYNVGELLERGWTRVGVLPIVFDPRRYAVRPDRSVLERYQDGLNVLFVGRLVPNKRFRDLILTFYHLKRSIRPDSRLLLVGSMHSTESYAAYLRDLIRKLGLSDVVFAGHVSAEEWVAYYQTASVYLSMSEHEGFGVPLLESMHFGLPIVAYKSAAVPETLGGAGMLLTERNHAAAAELIALLAEDRDLRERVVDTQRKRLRDFMPDRVQARLRRLLQDLDPAIGGS